jgi:hypothetical protein
MKPPYPGPTHVPCTVCGAVAGARCMRRGVALFPVHKTRLKAYQAWLQKQRKESNDQAT